MGRLTLFDDLDDSSPPTPGLREFALVTQRAQAIRRRRTAMVSSCTLATVVLATASVLWLGDEGRPQRVVVGGSDSVAPIDTAMEPSTTGDAVRYTFDEATRITQLPSLVVSRDVDLGPAADGALEVTVDADGTICLAVDRGATAEACVAGGAPFAYVAWTSTSSPPASTGAGGPNRLVILVDDAVDIAFVTVGSSCSTLQLGDEPARLWLCSDLDPSDAYVEIIGPNQLLISTPAQRG